jgi:hypothetical protein
LRKGKKETIKDITLPETKGGSEQGQGLKLWHPPGDRTFTGPRGVFRGFTAPNWSGSGGIGGMTRGGRGVMTSLFRVGDRFTARHEEGSLIITLTGTAAGGQAKTTGIHIQDGGDGHDYTGLDQVPERYRDKVKNLLEVSEKGSAKIEVKEP